MKLVPRFRKQWFAYLTVLCLAWQQRFLLAYRQKRQRTRKLLYRIPVKKLMLRRTKRQKQNRFLPLMREPEKQVNRYTAAKRNWRKTFKPYSLRALSELMNAPESPALHLFHIEQPFNCQSSIPTLQALMDVPDF